MAGQGGQGRTWRGLEPRAEGWDFVLRVLGHWMGEGGSRCKETPEAGRGRAGGESREPGRRLRQGSRWEEVRPQLPCPRGRWRGRGLGLRADGLGEVREGGCLCLAR